MHERNGNPCWIQGPELRVRAKITYHFRIPSSGHLCPIQNRKILERVLLLLWLYDFESNKANLNLGANSVKLFLREPLDVSVRRGDQKSLPRVCFAWQMEWFFWQFGCLLFRRFTYRHRFDLGFSLKFDGRLEISPVFY